MAFTRRSGGANVAVTTAKRRSAGAWVNVSTVKRRLSGAWVTVWAAAAALAASVDKTSVSYTGTGTASGAVVTLIPSLGPTTSATGGYGSYTYAWQYVSGSTQISAMAATSANTGFTTSPNAVADGSTVSAVFRCAVSDGTSTAYTPNVSVSLSYSTSPP